MKKIKPISSFIALASLVFLFCGTDPSSSSGTTTSLIIIWNHSSVEPLPAGVDSIRLTISSSSMDNDLVKSFLYETKQGIISDVPIGISITIKIEGIESTGQIAYHGAIEIPEVEETDMLIIIGAMYVTPPAPSNLDAIELSHNQIKLTWSDNSNNESFFIIHRYNTSTSAYDSIAIAIDSSYTDLGLLPLTTYRYFVKAYNSVGYSDPSNIDSATITASDTSGPTIIIESHTNPDTVNKRTIVLYGTVSDSSGIYQFFVNSTLADLKDELWIIEDFTLPDTLANRLILKAIDNSVLQNTTIETLTIVYKEDFVDTINHAPVFTVSSSYLTDTVKALKKYEKILRAIDQDANDSIWFEVCAGLSLSVDTIQWIPQMSDIGVHSFYAIVYDRKLAKDLISWTVTVVDTGTNLPNNPPVFITIESDLLDKALLNYEYLDTLHAQDIDDDNLTFSRVSGPDSMIIGPVSGIISWTPADTGLFNVTARVTDDSSAYDEITWAIQVFIGIPDTLLPVITLLGDTNMNVALYDTFLDPGALAIDNIDGDISNRIVVTGTVNTQQIGSYALRYNVTDDAGNAAVEKIRTVNVKFIDNIPPVISINPPNPMNILVGSSYYEWGATATDDIDGDITHKLDTVGFVDVNTNDSVNTNVAGIYRVHYIVSDSAGNKADTMRIVNVFEFADTIPPVLTLLGDNPMALDSGDEYNEPGATAFDNKDGDITDSIKINADSVNTSVVGVYRVHYTVADKANNTTHEIRIVNVGLPPADSIIIGTGITTGQYLPMECYYAYTYSQSIYMKNELNVPGPITIDSICYYYTGNSSFSDAIRVYMGNTSQTSYTAMTDWISEGSMTQVYNGNYTVGPSEGWYTIRLSTPFIYNNTNNLVIAFDENTAGYHNDTDEFRCSSKSATMSIYYYADATNPSPSNPPTTANGTTDFIGGKNYCPNIVIHYH